jgi:hypothetical protein
MINPITPPYVEIEMTPVRTRQALWALGFLLPAPSLGTAAAMFWWPGQPVGVFLFAVAKIWTVLLPWWWLRFVDRQRSSWSQARRGGWGAGVVSGLLIALVVWAAYAVASRVGVLDAAMVAERAARTGLDHRGLYLAGALYWITLNSLLEEYVWRWFVFRQFEAIVGPRWAVLAAALAFTTHHVVALAGQFDTGLAIVGSVGVFTGGVTWSWLYRRYGSIWPGYVSHALVDVAVFVIGYRLIFGEGLGP